VIKALITGLAESNGKAAALVVAANKKGIKLRQAFTVQDGNILEG